MNSDFYIQKVNGPEFSMGDRNEKIFQNQNQLFQKYFSSQMNISSDFSVCSKDERLRFSFKTLKERVILHSRFGSKN
jgi:hypothetical protein